MAPLFRATPRRRSRIRRDSSNKLSAHADKILCGVAVAVVVKKYSAERLDDCVALLAEAFATNPLHLSAFGPERMDQNRTFFRIGLRRMFVGQSFVALRGERVCGYVHFNPSPFCLPAPEEIPTAVATLLTRRSARAPRPDRRGAGGAGTGNRHRVNAPLHRAPRAGKDCRLPRNRSARECRVLQEIRLCRLPRRGTHRHTDLVHVAPCAGLIRSPQVMNDYRFNGRTQSYRSGEELSFAARLCGCMWVFTTPGLRPSTRRTVKSGFNAAGSLPPRWPRL
jgi:hypothetical protein